MVTLVSASFNKVAALQLDVMLVDLDGGDIKTPESVKVPLISEPMLARAKKSLNMVSALSLSLTFSFSVCRQ